MGLMDARACGEAGQMTIEFVVAFPVMLIVAAIAVNACSFFGVCAACNKAAMRKTCRCR